MFGSPLISGSSFCGNLISGILSSGSLAELLEHHVGVLLDVEFMPMIEFVTLLYLVACRQDKA